jgi:hypothetical protein
MPEENKEKLSRRSFVGKLGLATVIVLSTTSKSLTQSSVLEGFGECYTCMNSGERGNRCPPYKGKQKRFPSGLCGAYEPVDVSLYNKAFGPKIEGLVARST